MTTVSSVVGFSLDDITSIDPFKDAYSIALFLPFATFWAGVLLLTVTAFLYSACECCCSTFTSNAI